MINSSFPNSRPRRNRSSSWIRNLVAENSLSANDLIMPFFVIDGENKKEEIKSLPSQYRFSIDLLIKEIQKAKELGINAIMLFPAIDSKLKNKYGAEALNPNNLICRTVREIKKQVPEIGVICDVALDPYTSHGHDGILGTDGHVLNDATIEILCKQASIQAEAGCDIVAPSDMMDGRIGKIRKYLDANGFENVGIISYAAKYASSFYGAFRNAIGSTAGSGGNLGSCDKTNYQMDFRNSNEALLEINLDIIEGADMLIIKPGLPYLDIVVKAKASCNLPIISYQVSTEYAMLKLADREGLIDFESGLYESLIAFKRAGATAIISYAAMEICEIMKNSRNIG
ncbi:MAG: porphobilinogen synthase [Rickettsiales bacterium]|jgi:porphobilinogen synthase